MNLKITTFVPVLRDHALSVANAEELETALAPFRKERDLYVTLDHPMKRGIAQLASFSMERAWLTHIDELDQSLANPDSHAYHLDDRSKNDDGYLVFLLGNGRAQHVHRACTVSREEALHALSYFSNYNKRDPRMEWHDCIDLW